MSVSYCVVAAMPPPHQPCPTYLAHLPPRLYANLPFTIYLHNALPSHTTQLPISDIAEWIYGLLV